MNFKEYIIIFLKGILLGTISMGIPGISASTVALIIGLYFVLVEKIANLFKDFKKNVLFIIALMFGYGVGAIIAAFCTTLLFENFPLITTFVIIAILFATIISMSLKLKNECFKISNWITFAIVLVFILAYNFLITEGGEASFPEEITIWYLIRMLFLGLVTSTTFIIPGMDFAIVFMSLGMYYPFMNLLIDLVSFTKANYLISLISNLKILVFYLIGYGIGIFLFSKLIKYLTNKFKSQTDFASLAFIVASPAIFLRNCVILNTSFYTSTIQYIIGSILAIASFITIIFFNKYNKKESIN